ncbi:MAG: hypothetical protein DWQ05_22575 [Calditrichaeota bacterium]|nr:MAG: hypothetical protein DWQ05_22575 [Calditrichota bacterium]
MKSLNPGLFVATLLLTSTHLLAQVPDYIIMQHVRPSAPSMAAMGYTGTAFLDGHWAPVSNPAGLAFVERPTFSYTYAPPFALPFGDTVDKQYYRQHVFSASVPLAHAAFGFYYFNIGFGEHSYTDETSPISIGKYEPKLKQYQMSAAFNFGIFNHSQLSLGTTAKYLHHDYFFYEGKTFLFDFGARSDFVTAGKTFSFGLAINNIGGNIEYKAKEGDSRDEEVAKLVKAGFALHNSGFEDKSDQSMQYLISLEFQQNFNDESYLEKMWKSLGIGAELRFFNHLFGQIGYLYDLYKDEHANDYKGVTYGFGFETPEPVKIIIPVYISAAYGRGVDVGLLDMNIISLGISLDLK